MRRIAAHAKGSDMTMRNRRATNRPVATERLVFLAICVATLLFALITPPFQSPDENQHYMKALHLARGHVLAQQRGSDVGAELPRDALDLYERDFPPEEMGVPRRFDPASFDNAWHADADRPGTDFGLFPNIANYAPTMYAPQALGIALGEWSGLPRLGGFYLGRLVNLSLSLLLLALAMRLMPFGRIALLAIAALPTFSHQIGSNSPDAIINGLGFVALALALRFGQGTARQGGTGAIMIVTPLLALAKGVYLPLMAAGLRWPTDRRDRRPWILISAMALGTVVFVLWMKANGGTQALYSITSRKTGESVMTAPLADQLGVILGDPVGYTRILISSMIERGPVYALQIVGRFGWNTILLPLLAYPLAALMLGAAILSGAGARYGLVQRLWWIAVAAGCAVLVETACYLIGTPYGADYIQGVQGRYFLPALPLVLLALMPAGAVPHAEKMFKWSALLLLAIGPVTALDSFWIHGFTSVDGMPPHSSLIRALFLPSPRW
jgi:uncharacterized membrane protein